MKEWEQNHGCCLLQGEGSQMFTKADLTCKDYLGNGYVKWTETVIMFF